MLLNEIGKSPTTTLSKINTYLESNYKFKISEGVQYHDLVAIMEQIQDEIADLKMNGEDAKSSPEISKRLLVLEGIKSLKEFAMVQFQSPLLDKVVKNLVDFVVDTFHISATGANGQQAFERGLEKAMDEYRSSRYRFPDDMIEQRVRQEAMQQIQSSQTSPTAGPGMTAPVMEDDLDEDSWGGVGKRAQASGGHAASVPDTDRGRQAMKALDNPSLSLAQDEKPVPMVRGKDGRMVPDPFAAHAAARRQGIVR